jgi:hypothetical protein
MIKLFGTLFALFWFAPLAAQAQVFSVVYSRVPNGISDGTVWIAASDGSSDQPITMGEWPRISPDGNSMLFHRGPNAEPNRPAGIRKAFKERGWQA